jgi:N-acetyl-anhydromuramyl-L-alanine amidase AmpD
MPPLSNKPIDDICPLATSLIEPHRHSGLPFQGHSPSGVTIHYTGGRSLQGAVDALKAASLNYHIIIDREGKIVQTAYLRWRVYHAGKAMWNGQSPNQTHAAVAVLSYGELEQAHNQHGDPILVSWAGSTVKFDQAAHRPDNSKLGDMSWWDKCTPVQEHSLVSVLEWFIGCGISPDNVSGHDESALPDGRKRDPGGVLSFTMSELRDRLKKTWEFRA